MKQVTPESASNEFQRATAAHCELLGFDGLRNILSVRREHFEAWALYSFGEPIRIVLFNPGLTDFFNLHPEIRLYEDGPYALSSVFFFEDTFTEDAFMELRKKALIKEAAQKEQAELARAIGMPEELDNPRKTGQRRL